MSVKIIFLILLILSTAEIFFNVFSITFNKIFSRGKGNKTLPEKPKVALKLMVVAVFFASVIYFLIEVIIFLASIFGIPLNQSIFDIF